MPGFWDDIFGQLSGGDLQQGGRAFPYATLEPPVQQVTGPQDLSGPPMIDERVNPPTPTERQGLEGAIVGNMWNDPIALSGYSPGAINWDRPVPPATGPRAATPRGAYSPPLAYWTNPETIAEYGQFANQIRFAPGTMTQPYGPNSGVHEFTHRGLYNLADAARRMNVPFDPSTAPVEGYPYHLDENAVVMEDLRRGYENDPHRAFTPEHQRFYGAMLQHLRDIADQINAERVRRMHATGGTWSDVQ